MRATLLTWNLAADHLGRLRYLCLRLGVQLRTVTAAETALPIDALLKQAPAPASAEALPFDEPMLLMCGFSPAQFHGLLDRWAEIGLPPVPLKAVLTAQNRRWTGEALHAALAEERAQTSASGSKS
ncbi:MAG: DUF3783 domain-containing protein [Clostridia bacterium]|nr:DUF3783 domain-containing protein [Clostridia bacterium]